MVRFDPRHGTSWSTHVAPLNASTAPVVLGSERTHAMTCPTHSAQRTHAREKRPRMRAHSTGRATVCEPWTWCASRGHGVRAVGTVCERWALDHRGGLACRRVHHERLVVDRTKVVVTQELAQLGGGLLEVACHGAKVVRRGSRRRQNGSGEASLRLVRFG
jgi:hypothetical protein